VVSVAALLVGCGDGDRSWTMFPAPVVMKDPRLDFSRFVAPEHRTTDVQVFYATTRAPFWFRIVATLPPPATVAPAPTAV